MILRISAKLGKKIHLAPDRILPADLNPFADWSAHLFTADRTQYVLISNTISLYSMVMFGRGLTDDCRFLDRVTGYMSDVITEPLRYEKCQNQSQRSSLLQKGNQDASKEATHRHRSGTAIRE